MISLTSATTQKLKPPTFSFSYHHSSNPTHHLPYSSVSLSHLNLLKISAKRTLLTAVTQQPPHLSSPIPTPTYPPSTDPESKPNPPLTCYPAVALYKPQPTKALASPSTHNRLSVLQLLLDSSFYPRLIKHPQSFTLHFRPPGVPLPSTDNPKDGNYPPSPPSMTIFTPESTPMRDTAPTGIRSLTAAHSPLTFWSSHEPYRAPGELKKNPIVPLGTQPATPAPEEPPAGSAKTIKDARNMVEDMQARIQYLGRVHRSYSGCAPNFDVCHQMYVDALQALVAEGKRKIEEAESSKQAIISEPIDIPSAIKTPVSNVKFNPTIESKPTTPKNSCLSMAVVRRRVSVSNPITENTTRDSRNPTQVRSINVEEVFNILNRTKNPDQLGQFWRHAEPISLSASPLNGIACSTTRFRKSLSATPSNAMASPTDRLRMSMSPTPSNSTPCPMNRFTELDDCQARTNPITKMINGALRVKRTLLSESSAGPTEPVTGPLVKRIRASEDLLITASAHLSGKPSSVTASLLVKPSSDPSQQHSSASDSLATNNKKAADFQKDSPHQTADTNLSLASDSLSTNNEKEADCQKDSPRQTTDTNLSLAVDSLSDPLSSDLSHHETTNAQKTSSPQKDLPAQTSDADQSSAGVSILDELSTARTTDTNQSSASTSPANMLTSNSSQQTEKTNHPQKDLPAQTTDTNQSSASNSLSGELGSDSSQQRGAKSPTNTEISRNPAKDSTAPTTNTNISPSLADEPSSNSTQLGQSNTNNTSTPQKDLPAQSTELNESARSTSQSNNLSSSLTRVQQEEDETTPDEPTPDLPDEPTRNQPDKANDGRPAREAALNSRKRTSQVSGGPSVPRKRPKPAKPSESQDVSVNQSNFDFLGEPINLTLLLKPDSLWRAAAHVNILHSIRDKKGDAPTFMMPMLQEVMPSIVHTQVHRATSLQCLRPSQTTTPQTRDVLDTSTELWSELSEHLSGPRLFQLPWPHPFFNREHVQMDVLIHGIDELIGKDRAGGWTALQSMMCRSSEKGHQNTFDFKQPLKEATQRIHQLVMDSTTYLQPDDGDLPQASHEDTRQEIECKGLGRVGVWLSDQVAKYEPKNNPDQHHKAHRDGMDFLMKRCWEMLHGGSIMHESYDTFTRKRHGHQAPRKVEQRASASKQGKDASAPKNTKHDLHAKRLKSCSSLVLFLNFGVAGWFHCHMNRQRFNFQDLTSLMMLAQEMSLNGLSIRSPLIKTNGSTRKTTHEAIHRPWERLNDYLIRLLIEIGLGNPRIDWWTSAPICKARLQPDVLAPLVIKDFFEEILKPGDTLSSTGGPAPTPKYDESYLKTWQSRVKNLFLTPQKYAKLQRDRFSNMGVMSPRRGEDEEDTETDDSDDRGEDELDELDGKSLSGDDDEEGSEEDGEDEDALGEVDEDALGGEDEG
ncbi:Golgi to ER traffic- protein [Puccinia graminis f. sp. tritici]|uniref:Golgi to ER traffic-protein n=1 Tax=Puccinia graminis f. sp. tritici TaxID=56615 RepID=A0A5B0M1S9_PUCGR|nr:Golgi to ER traffic- protein [Puccinia graminis f. sp. tritici]